MQKLVAFVGGAGDRFTHVMHRVYSRVELGQVEKGYFYWDQGQELNRWLLEHPLCDAVLIGHSWGAVTALRQALVCPRNIELLITLDPVSWRRPRGQPAMPWLNVYVPVSQHLANRNNLIAWVGRHWGAVAGADRNLCLPEADHACVGSMLAQVQGLLNATLMPDASRRVLPMLARRTPCRRA